MTIAETIYQHSLNLPEDVAREALDYLSSVHIEWNGKPIANRNALYDDSRN